jgi:hypothetical protein
MAHQAQQQLELQALEPALLAAALQDISLPQIAAVPLLLNPLAVQQQVQWTAGYPGPATAAGPGAQQGLRQQQQDQQQQQVRWQHQGYYDQAVATAAAAQAAIGSAAASPFSSVAGGLPAGMQQAAAAAAATQQGLQQFMAVGAVSGYPQELLQQQQTSKAEAAAGAYSSLGALAMQQVQQQTDVLLAQGSPTLGQQQQQPQVPTMMEWQQQHELQLQSAEGSTSTELFSFPSSSDSQVRRTNDSRLLRRLTLLVHDQLCAHHAFCCTVWRKAGVHEAATVHCFVTA